MKKVARFFRITLISLILIQLLACTSDSEQDVSAEETLLAVYLQQTLTADNSNGSSENEGSQHTTSTSELEPIPSTFPDEMPDPVRTLADSDSSARASECRVLSGDNFLDNHYERPFTSQEMIYQPDLDIFSVDFAYDDEFFYFTINLNGLDEETGKLLGTYGIEFDRSLKGRGDLLVLVENPIKEWSIINVIVLVDENRDVGGPHPIVADVGFNGSGYDEEFTLEGEKVAFTRLSPEYEDSVQFAVSRALLGNPEKFLWGAWADNGLKNFGNYDYNDSMAFSEAGSPFRDNEYYPIKSLYSLDNTCRLSYGFEQIGASNPGICKSVPPPPEPRETDTPPNT